MLFSIMSNLQTHHHRKLDFQKVNQYTGAKWLLHGTKHRKDNQSQYDLPNFLSSCHNDICTLKSWWNNMVLLIAIFNIDVSYENEYTLDSTWADDVIVVLKLVSYFVV